MEVEEVVEIKQEVIDVDSSKEENATEEPNEEV